MTSTLISQAQYHKSTQLRFQAFYFEQLTRNHSIYGICQQFNHYLYRSNCTKSIGEVSQQQVIRSSTRYNFRSVAIQKTSYIEGPNTQPLNSLKPKGRIFLSWFEFYSQNSVSMSFALIAEAHFAPPKIKLDKSLPYIFIQPIFEIGSQ